MKRHSAFRGKTVTLHTLGAKVEALNSTVKQIQQCGVHCSKGQHCKSRHHLSLSHCKKQQDLNNGTTIHDVKLSVVMRCEEDKCSLNLNIVIMMTLYDDVHGVVMCVHSAGMVERCQIVTFSHKARKHVAEKKVEVQYDCFSVRPEQDVFVTLKTAPNFCNNVWTKKYSIPNCAHEAIRRKVTECITGELTYTVDTARREITVMVLEAPKDIDYNLRLCLKGHTCIGTGPHRLIKRQDLNRNESFLYSKALPCLCIEGWPASTNARRTQICPFKNNMQELWSGVTYDQYTQALSWKPMCPVKAVVSLCHAVGPKMCLDIGNMSLSSESNNVIFSTLDPHPQLCMKFTTEADFWIECPFSSERFPVWDLKVVSKAQQHSVEITSWFPVRFSVGLCKLSSSTTCKPAEESQFLIASVDRTKPAVFNLSTSMCNSSICVQVRRIDVVLAIEEQRCNLQCSDQQFDQWSDSETLQKYTPPLIVCVIALVMAALVGNLTLKACVCVQRKQKPDKIPTHRATAETETLIHTVSEDMDTRLHVA
ncbi:putative interleukin-17 receptor E-like isoform X1 [Pygocentrus nattereri]|uniref:Interleukin-17 receptor C/E N-terminal domain-containing protein n=2 Tax=Pygocentrus nattereri TaxID=42514 RepID=A0A3B4CBZ0_PYGNA|nr:putative interleukin-17 receptor E-like isoform X1 [Pygocentrus nattereri]